jgi:hypothetical protein
VSKDKRKKHKSDDADGGKSSKKKGSSKGSAKLKALVENPLVADVVAAALIGMASALKDSDKARRLAGKASDELGKMAKSNAKQGSAMWDLALDVGRQTLNALADEVKSGKRGKTK